MPLRLKKGDEAVILSGKDKGKSGKILRVWPEEERVLVEGVNVRKRHQRARRAGTKGSVVEVAMPIHSARVLPKCPRCGKPARVGIAVREDGSKSRVCKKCGGEF
ncbi:MAG: 50S ribosomal protein L24 [Patescibacteria group bacterium]